jgi:hypothetical protein
MSSVGDRMRFGDLLFFLIDRVGPLGIPRDVSLPGRDLSGHRLDLRPKEQENL